MINFKKIIALCSSLGLAFGVSLPMISVPIIGNINLYAHNQLIAMILLLIAIVSILVLLLNKDTKWLFIMGLSACLSLLYEFIVFQIKISELKQHIQEQLAGNPFIGIADSAVQNIQFQWGWSLLVISSILLLVCNFIQSNPFLAKDGEELEQNFTLDHEFSSIFSTMKRFTINLLESFILFVNRYKKRLITVSFLAVFVLIVFALKDNTIATNFMKFIFPLETKIHIELKNNIQPLVFDEEDLNLSKKNFVIKALIKKGIESYKEKSYSTAFIWLLPSALLDDEDATYMLGILSMAPNARQNLARAENCFTRAALKDHPPSQYQLSYFYSSMSKLKTLDEDSVHLLREQSGNFLIKSSENHYSRAQYLLGLTYLNNDFNKGFNLIKAASKQGNKHAKAKILEIQERLEVANQARTRQAYQEMLAQQNRFLAQEENRLATERENQIQQKKEQRNKILKGTAATILGVGLGIGASYVR